MNRTIRDSEAKPDSFTDLSVDVFLLLDENLNLLNINDAGQKMFGVSGVDAFGKCIADIMPDIKKTGIYKKCRSVLKTGESIVMHKNVGDRSLVVKVFKLGNGLGLIASDMTERKRVEEALQISETRYRRLFEAAQDGILLLDAETGQISEANPFIIDLLGYSREELLGKKLWEIGAFKDIQASKLAFGELQSKGHVHYENLPLETKDGRSKEVEFVSNVYLVDSKRVIQCNIRDITEHKRAEEALRKSEERYRTLVDSTDDFIFSYNLDGCFMGANLSLCRMLGLTPEQVIVKSCKILRDSPEQLRKWEDVQERVKSTGEMVSAEISRPMPNGDVLYSDIRLSPVRDENGNVVGFSCISRDITERKLGEKQREFSLQLLEILNRGGDQRQLIRDIVMLIKEFSDFEAVGIRINAGEDFPYYETNGFGEDFLSSESSLCTRDLNGQLLRDEIGNPLLECMCGNIICGRFDPQKPFFTHGGSFWTNSTTELLASTSEANRQARTRNRCNGEGYESVALIPLKSEGATVGLLQLNDKRRNRFTLQLIEYYEGIGQSIGILLARKKAEEALKESEKHCSALVENLIDAVFLFKGGIITWCNDKVEEIYGYPKEELLSKRASFFYPNDINPSEFTRILSSALKERGLFNGTTRFQRKNGSIVDIEYSLSQISGKAPIEIMAVARDITERKRAEKERESLLAKLSEKNKELEQIIYVTSHDLRSPLVSIQGFTKELDQALKQLDTVLDRKDIPPALKQKLDSTLNEDIPASLQYILASSAKMDSLLSGLLQISRLGRVLLNIQKLDMNKLMSEVVSSFEFQVKEAGATVKIEELPPCYGDNTQINQVFSNLLGNALKFLDPERPGVIRISGKEEKEQVVYCVEDNGIGIAEKDKNAIFEMFCKLDSDDKRGEGLGLTIVRKILERHGGKVWVESELGLGSKFLVSLPKNSGQ